MVNPLNLQEYFERKLKAYKNEDIEECEKLIERFVGAECIDNKYHNPFDPEKSVELGLEPIWMKLKSDLDPPLAFHEMALQAHCYLPKTFEIKNCITSDLDLWLSKIVASNLLGDREYLGAIVYVGWYKFKDWFFGSRKASDLWVASWSSSVTAWKAVEEFVWRLGPDVYWEPGFLLNQYYFALLKGRAQQLFNKYEDELRKYDWEGFPYYPWKPSHAVLVLPLLRDVPEDLKVLEYSGNPQEKAKELKEFFVKELRRSWRIFIEAVKEGVQNANFTDVFADWFGKVAELAAEFPHAEPLVTAVVIEGFTAYSSEGEVRNFCSFRDLMLFFETSLKKAKKELEKMPERSWIGLLTKKKDRLMELRRCGTKNLCYEMPEIVSPCSVCGRSVDVLRVPGRDVGKEVTEEYKKFAEAVVGDEEQWKVLRPIFRPREGLCPHCLVKRLAGLPGVYQKAGEKLFGYFPQVKVTEEERPVEKEVKFPSTDDFAAMATKVAMLKVATASSGRIYKIRELKKGRSSISDIPIGQNFLQGYKNVLESAISMPTRSGAVKKAQEVLREVFEEIVGDVGTDDKKVLKALRKFITGNENEKENEDEKRTKNKLEEALWRLFKVRWWTPRLLYLNAKELVEEVMKTENIASLALALATLILVDAEFWSAFDTIKGALEGFNGMLNELRDEFERETFRALREALRRPRTYYALVRFDADNLGYLNMGLLPNGNKRIRGPEDVMPPEKYDEKTGLKGEGRKESAPLTIPYRVNITIASSFALHGVHRLALALGGFPIDLAADEGFAFLPAWMPEELIKDHLSKIVNELIVRPKVEKYASDSAPLEAVRLHKELWVGKEGFYWLKVRPVPALSATGLSFGVRLAHHKDHLYSELRASEELLEEAKGEGGNKVAVGFGRGRPPEPVAIASGAPKLPLNDLNKLKRASELLKSVGRAVSIEILRAVHYVMPYDEALVAVERELGKKFVTSLASYLALRRNLKEEVLRELASGTNVEEFVSMLDALYSLYLAKERVR